MTTLIFKVKAWDFVTPAWTAGADEKGKVVLCYPWGLATGRITLAIDMTEFLSRISGGGIVDLRQVEAHVKLI
jgi:hypothetical protein